jgi:PHD/YefM family antitoxin component YafN of YafNO toxin-antitoxin module
MINLKENIKPLSYIISHPDEALNQVTDSGSPMIITQEGEAKVVLLDVQRYQSMVDTINLLRLLSLGENDIRNGRFSTTEELDKKVAAILEPSTEAQGAALG